MTEIRIERKRRPWWLLILILLIVVAVGAWLYYNETIRQPPADDSQPQTIGAEHRPQTQVPAAYLPA